MVAVVEGAEPIVDWAKAGWEWLGFLGAFGTLGALGYRFAVCDRVYGDALLLSPRDHGAGVSAALGRTDATAGLIGFFGALLATASLFGKMVRPAAKSGQSVIEYAAQGNAMQSFTVIATLAVVVLFALAWRRVHAAWPFAMALAIALILRNAVVGEWAKLINPLHESGGALWLGTLFVLVVAGFPAAADPDVPAPVRGALFARMVKAFNPLALGGAALSAIFGITTALRHVPRLNALWSTPYGLVLDAKLCLVAVIASMGFYHWRHLTPQLGTDPGVVTLSRSARREVMVAAVLLVVTAILVSTPDIDAGPGGP